jgi:hypothetical protein
MKAVAISFCDTLKTNDFRKMTRLQRVKKVESLWKKYKKASLPKRKVSATKRKASAAKRKTK